MTLHVPSLDGPSVRETVRTLSHARQTKRRVAEADDAARAAANPYAAARARERALSERRRLIRWLAQSYLPPSMHGVGLVQHLDDFLAERGEEMGPDLLDALAHYLTPTSWR